MPRFLIKPIEYQHVANLCLLCAFFAFWSSPNRAVAQNNIPDCFFKQSMTEEESISCLRESITTLLEEQRLYREVTASVLDEQRELIEQLIKEDRGPPKELIVKPPQLVSIHGYWTKGGPAGNLNHICSPAPQANKDQVAFGFKPVSANYWVNTTLTALHQVTGVMFPQDPAACRPGAWCDSSGESCTVHAVSGGCFVSRQWHDWAVRKAARLGLVPGDLKYCEPEP